MSTAIQQVNRVRVTLWLPPGLDVSEIIWDEPQPQRTERLCAKVPHRKVRRAKAGTSNQHRKATV